MDFILDAPVPPIKRQQSFRIGLFAGEIGDAIIHIDGGLQLARFPIAQGSLPRDAKHRSYTGPAQSSHQLIESGCRLDRSLLTTAVAFAVLGLLLPFSSPLLDVAAWKMPHQVRRIRWKWRRYARVDQGLATKTVADLARGMTWFTRLLLNSTLRLKLTRILCRQVMCVF
jgi:hypothetical protein